ncbi:MAG: fibronectin type III-like domain-contianing protein [Bacteroidales bacterium]
MELDRVFLTSEEPFVKVTFNILNTGKVKGDEVAQLYVRDLESGEIQAKKKLRAFERITLEPGESQTVEFTLDLEDFSYWSEEKEDWYVEPGEFEIQVGSSSEEVRLKQIVTVN